jgi:hypothetical protein
LYEITLIQQWQSGGGLFIYDSAWSTANSGYPKGAILQSSDGATMWLSTADNNTTDPDGATPAGWVSLAAYGITAVTGLTNANVTLSSTQYGKNIITFAGTLTGNVQIIFPTSKREWLVINNTAGQFTLTCKTAAGTGTAITQGGYSRIYGDGTNINAVSNAGRLLGVQIISATGTYTPTPGMSFVIVPGVGGGAAGGGTGATGGSTSCAAGGGASGSYAVGLFTAAQIGAGVAVTIGAGGTPGAAGANNGGNGGTTSFGALMSIPGGLGGIGTAAGTAPVGTAGGNPGAIATGGNICNATGMPGINGFSVTGMLRSGGGGGSPLFNGGGGGKAVSDAVGNAGDVPGAGGGGAGSSFNNSARAGGAGVAGQIIVYEYA